MNRVPGAYYATASVFRDVMLRFYKKNKRQSKAKDKVTSRCPSVCAVRFYNSSGESRRKLRFRTRTCETRRAIYRLNLGEVATTFHKGQT